MRADVPVGFELSGGMDSSALVALAAASFDKPMEVFTVSWPGSEVDEEVYARQVADQYKSVIHYNVLTPPQEDFFEQVDEVVWMMEQPFRTPSALTYQTILSAMRDKGMRVSINGLGGDENFAGYGLYRRPYLRHLLRNGKFVALLRSAERSGSVSDRLSLSDSLARLGGLARKALKRDRSTGALLGGVDSGAPTGDPFDAVLRLPPGIQPLAGPSPEINQLLVDYMGEWQMNYWQRVVNQSSMAIPVEVRSPLLDQRIVEFAFRLPLDFILRDGWTKWILRHAVSDVLPESVLWRRFKQGFPFPHAEWLAANRQAFFSTTVGLDCPYVDLAQLETDYERLRAHDPIKLWRVMSLALWWKRCIQGDSLQAAA
jgi:asparagine synthase (glutamine-hydrolysing)